MRGLLGLNLPAGLTIDRVVVAPGLLAPGDPLAAGTVNVFQKIFFRRLSLVDDSTGTTLFSERRRRRVDRRWFPISSPRLRAS